MTEGQWKDCPGSWSNGESVGGCGGGCGGGGGGGGSPLRLRQMGGCCLTMLEPTCCSSPCWEDVEETEGRLEPRILFMLELTRYGTLLLVIGIPPKGGDKFMLDPRRS